MSKLVPSHLTTLSDYASAVRRAEQGREELEQQQGIVDGLFGRPSPALSEALLLLKTIHARQVLYEQEVALLHFDLEQDHQTQPQCNDIPLKVA